MTATRVARPLAAPLAAAVLVGSLLTGCTAAGDGGADDGATGTSAPGSPAPAAPASPGAGAAAPVPASGSVTPLPTPAQVQALLDRRSAAVRAGDRAAYLATSGPGDAGAADRFAALRALPLGEWTAAVATVGPPGPDDPPADAVAEVDLAWSLAGADRRPASLRQRVALTRGAEGWQVAGERAADDRAALWDLGGDIRVASGPRTLVLGVGVPRRPAPDPAPLVPLAESAVQAVDAAWGQDWDRRLVVVLPARGAGLGGSLGRSAATLRQVPAIAAGDRRAPAGGPPPQRVWINPDTWPTLGAQARDIVLRHEGVHVAARSDQVGTPPLWWEEGLAEYVGYAGSGVPDAVVGRDVVAAARVGDVPEQLPADEDFAPDGAGFARAYQWSWLAVRTLVQHAGLPAVVAAYRRLLDEPGPADPAARDALLDRVLVEETGWTTSQLTAAWRRAARALAAGSS